MKLNKHQLAAMRSCAIHGIRQAIPTATACEIASAMGMDRSAVQYHLDGHYKGEMANRSPWAEQFYEACQCLGCGANDVAADGFETLAKTLREIAAEMEAK
jgi:DNA-binding transcriptional ArsR family regulator